MRREKSTSDDVSFARDEHNVCMCFIGSFFSAAYITTDSQGEAKKEKAEKLR